VSRDASLTIPWADGDYAFRLAIGQLRELQEKCDAGPMVIWQRLRDGSWRTDDISSVLRLGLIGGGADPVKALKLVRSYVEEPGAYLANAPVAMMIVWKAIAGAPDEDETAQKKSAKPQEDRPPSSPTASSASPTSMELGPQ
jgi:hypothetical protein